MAINNPNESAIVSEDRYLVSFEIKTRYSKTFKQVEAMLPKDRIPDVALFTALIVEHFKFVPSLPRQMNPMLFRPEDWTKTDILEVAMTRSAKDVTYRKVTKL